MRPFDPAKPQAAWTCEKCGKRSRSSTGVCQWPDCGIRSALAERYGFDPGDEAVAAVAAELRGAS